MMDGEREAIELLLQHSKTTMWVVTVQLIAAILMIGVEACLLWAILKLARYMMDLIKKMQYLTLKVEVILEEMGWQTTKKFMEETADGASVEEAEARALHDARIREELLEAQAEAGLGPEAST